MKSLHSDVFPIETRSRKISDENVYIAKFTPICYMSPHSPNASSQPLKKRITACQTVCVSCANRNRSLFMHDDRGSETQNGCPCIRPVPCSKSLARFTVSACRGDAPLPRRRGTRQNPARKGFTTIGSTEAAGSVRVPCTWSVKSVPAVVIVGSAAGVFRTQ